MFEGKKIIIFGERDEMSAESLTTCLKAAGVKEEDIVHGWTDCFV